MTNNTNSANADKGQATISSFRYHSGYCFGTLNNGISGILGSSSDMPLSVMLALKGMSVVIAYEYSGMSQDGQFMRYKLDFVL
jgi:hypothetical protein